MANKVEKFVIDKAKALEYSAAATLLNTLYPRDFEAYMIAFELCDSRGKTLDYMTFPIMPNDITVDESMPVSIQNTFGGVSAVSANVYTSKNISINGSFGRNMKILSRSNNALGSLISALSISSRSTVERTYGLSQIIPHTEAELSKTFKTGYGCCKVLQSILNKAYDVDTWGAVNKLYFYNMALGESYLIKPINFKLNQNMSSNAIWNYSLQMQTICPLYLDKGNGSVIGRALNGVVNASLNGLLNKIR